MLAGRDDCDCDCDDPDAGGAGNAVAMNEEDGIGFAPSGLLPILDEEADEVENVRVEVGLSVLGVLGIEFERGGVGRVGGLGAGAGAGVWTGNDEEKDGALKGEGDAGLCACDAWPVKKSISRRDHTTSEIVRR